MLIPEKIKKAIGDKVNDESGFIVVSNEVETDNVIFKVDMYYYIYKGEMFSSLLTVDGVPDNTDRFDYYKPDFKECEIDYIDILPGEEDEM